MRGGVVQSSRSAAAIRLVSDSDVSATTEPAWTLGPRDIQPPSLGGAGRQLCRDAGRSPWPSSCRRFAPNRGASNRATSSTSSGVSGSHSSTAAAIASAATGVAHHPGRDRGRRSPCARRPDLRLARHRALTRSHVRASTSPRSSVIIRADPLPLKSGQCCDQTDPAELALRIRHTTSGSDDRSIDLDDSQPVGLHRGEPLDADPERRHAIGLLHHDIHRLERRRFGRRVDTSRRHGARA